jgi:hypothetical protein
MQLLLIHHQGIRGCDKFEISKHEKRPPHGGLSECRQSPPFEKGGGLYFNALIIVSLKGDFRIKTGTSTEVPAFDYKRTL